jgi:hypothetical protein
MDAMDPNVKPPESTSEFAEIYHVISLISAIYGHLRCPNQKSCSEILSSSTFRLLNLLVLVSSQGTGIEWI